MIESSDNFCSYGAYKIKDEKLNTATNLFLA